jgi:hypothetical protein
MIDPVEIAIVAGTSTLTCVILDYGIHAIVTWQRRRAESIEAVGLGIVGRTILSFLLNGVTGTMVASMYRLVGTSEQDAFLIGAVLWLMVAFPALLTSRFVDETQKRLLATRVLGWLFKTAIAATCAALIMEIGSQP